jgi:hypothetical protein
MRLAGRRSIRVWLTVLIAVAITGTLAPSAGAQQFRGQPKGTFGTADLARLKWIEGTWEGKSPIEANFYEHYEFANDSTIEITYYSDSTLTRATGNGRVYLSVGKIFHTFGPGRWAATHIDESGAYFVPQTNAHNTLAWSFRSRDAWTATVRTGLSGHDRVTVYEMRRIGKR